MFPDWTDIAALAVYLAIWIGYNWITDAMARSGRSLSSLMNRERARWIRTALSRDLRMIDTAVLSSLQQGTGFFASACIFAIGGCFALLGSAEVISEISADISIAGTADRVLVEIKLLGLVVIFAYGFFKFAWSYRLFNYCAILIGALPMRSDAETEPEVAKDALDRAVAMNVVAGHNFNAGLRAIFFALAYLGWFLGPYVLIASTVFVVAIIANRQFRSPAVKALRDFSSQKPNE
ncbi:hypothetical protein FP2506_08146 [Fulvimarina pelagi HTCC2506]|uniref:DUF599 domain-containing protein n=1 Tax=Fulvimarina pelagi HTCC2506 TaxID=314231 RepID=Q0G6B7_9HYPH|nr:DUF599 family protein [Fulvimarina pelagi]EAU42797.1 hypothetical protein FP2506_08146 [Fulvimarina pelagi HTCC2506]